MHNGKHPSACNVDELSEQFVARMPNVSLQIECKKQHTVEDQSKLHDLLNGNVDNNGVYNSNELNRQKLLDAGVEAIYGTTSFLSGKELSSAKHPGVDSVPLLSGRLSPLHFAICFNQWKAWLLVMLFMMFEGSSSASQCTIFSAIYNNNTREGRSWWKRKWCVIGGCWNTVGVEKGSGTLQIKVCSI